MSLFIDLSCLENKLSMSIVVKEKEKKKVSLSKTMPNQIKIIIIRLTK